MASASAAPTLPSSTPFLTICSIAPRPLATAASDTSYIRVSYPAAMAACAIPCPIVPAPRTAICSTTKSQLTQFPTPNSQDHSITDHQSLSVAIA